MFRRDCAGRGIRWGGGGGLFVFVGGEGEVVAFDEIHEEVEQHRVDFLQAAVNAHALADAAVD